MKSTEGRGLWNIAVSRLQTSSRISVTIAEVMNIQECDIKQMIAETQNKIQMLSFMTKHSWLRLVRGHELKCEVQWYTCAYQHFDTLLKTSLVK